MQSLKREKEKKKVILSKNWSRTTVTVKQAVTVTVILQDFEAWHMQNLLASLVSSFYSL